MTSITKSDEDIKREAYEHIDPGNMNQLLELTSHSDLFETGLVGENDEGEAVLTSIHEEYLLTITYQSNNWIRKNYYYTDGTCEELYSRE